MRMFQAFDFFSQQGWDFLCDNSSSRRGHNDVSQEETQGQKSIINPEKIYEMEWILETEGIET